MADHQPAGEPIRSPTSGHERGKRISDLDAVQPSVGDRKPVDLGPDDARTLIDRVFRSYGLDPMEATDTYGWRYLSLGSAQGAVGVVEWRPGTYHLVVRAGILRLPPQDEPLFDFYRQLLELNHDGTLSACFSVHDGVAGVSLSRPIRGLDEVEVHDAIRAVMEIADRYDEGLEEILEEILRTAPVPLTELPNIEMKPSDAQTLRVVLGRCDAHGRRIFHYLVERWHRTGYIVAPKKASISLAVPLGLKEYSLANVRSGAGERRQRIVLGWEGLRRHSMFPAKAVDRFQSAVERITALHVTETTAHIEVTEAFDLEAAKALLVAMRNLAKAAKP